MSGLRQCLISFTTRGGGARSLTDLQLVGTRQHYVGQGVGGTRTMSLGRRHLRFFFGEISYLKECLVSICNLPPTKAQHRKFVFNIKLFASVVV